MKKIVSFIKKFLLSNGFAIFLRITLLIAIVIAIYNKDLISLFLAALAYILTFFNVVFKRINIKLPQEFQVIIILFIYCALFLGEIQDFYIKFIWWDILHHLFSSLSLGFIGFLILYAFYKAGKFDAPPIIIAVFSFCFALAILSLWEVFEFSIDSIFGANMQKSRNLIDTNGICNSRLGVFDTVGDIIIDSIGALITSVCGYIYLKKGSQFKFFDNIVKKFESLNGNLFK